MEAEEQRGVSAILNATTMWCAGFSDGDPVGTLGIFKLDGQLATPTVEATKFSVYPNPATSIITIATADVDGYKLSVTDLSGKTVMTKSLNGIENTVDVSSLATGAYFFELTSDSKREVVKILKN
ncbi:MAG: T9SS type A sorting domain-containing protein [Flavobacterium sp. JAD_PAG50586_2]|nr:MAG: T9SS type A sorting domain-containing protein [Flavobacterium sp. JAD_PAG50586_2]